MKHRAFTLIEAAVVVAIIVILAAILYPAFTRSNYFDPKSSCRTNLKQIGLGLIQYTQDYDEKFPPIANARAGYWVGSLQPYVKSWQVFQCPSEPNQKLKTTDYYYNARLAQIQSEKLGWPQTTILAGEGKGDQSPLYHLSQLPDAWRETDDSPAQRHGGDANYLFADGHVKWFAPDKITIDKPSANHPTFLLK